MNLDHLHDQLHPANLRMLQAIADQGSFAAAARTLDLVPSALSYRVRQREDALDVLLFNRQGRRAIPTAADLIAELPALHIEYPADPPPDA